MSNHIHLLAQSENEDLEVVRYKPLYYFVVNECWFYILSIISQYRHCKGFEPL